MNIFEVKADKKQYLPLLLLADEQEDMIDRYLERGTMYALKDGASVRAVCVVTDEGEGTLELKNLAAAPEYQRRGYGRRLVDFLSGVAYTNGGQIKPVANSTYIITPCNVNVMGESMIDELGSHGVYF